MQRRDLLTLFEDSPSLRPFAERILSTAFTNGRQAAERETGLLGIVEACPWLLDQVLDVDFLPFERPLVASPRAATSTVRRRRSDLDRGMS